MSTEILVLQKFNIKSTANMTRPSASPSFVGFNYYGIALSGMGLVI